MEIDALLDRLGTPAKAERRTAAHALAAAAQVDRTVRKQLVAALRDPHPLRRWGAAYTLSRLAPVPPASLPTLLDALNAADGDIRWATVAILGEMTNRSRVVRCLLQTVRAGRPVQRKMALYGLRQYRESSPRIDAVVLGALGDPDAGVRLAAASCAALIAADRGAAARCLLAGLADPHAGVRRAVAAALGTLGVRTDLVQSRLTAAATSRDPSLRRAAVRALQALTA